jgi:hypothetical protein
VNLEAATAKGILQMTRISIGLFSLVAAVLVSGPGAVSEQANAERVPDAKQARHADWPRWRGSNADGVAEGGNLPVRWSKTENLLWSVKLPGWGTSSPVVYGNKVFITSHQKGGKKALLTLCFDRKTGKELWRHDFWLWRGSADASEIKPRREHPSRH